MTDPRLIAALALPVLMLAGCGETPASAEAAPPAPMPTPVVEVESPLSTPDGTVRAMLALAKKGAWVEYVDDFYGEKHKFRPGKNDLETIAGKLESRSEMLITGLERVLTVEPTFENDGAHAVYDMGEGQRFTLYQTENGRWTFHL